MSAIAVLIIDDEADICTFFARLLGRKGHQVSTARNLPEVEQHLASASFQVALVDLKLPDTDGLQLLALIKERQPACEVILMTGFSTVRTAVAAIQQGAYDYLEKPFEDIGEIERLITRAAARNQGQSERPGKEDWLPVARAVGLLVGSSEPMRRLVELAFKVAAKPVNVLIKGNTGTGKEVLARFIHAASSRASQPFIPINCGALPETLLESELFGHERGAFTGASSHRKGIFELAHGGTLFLDEIGDASPAIQVKLLRILETGELKRVGGEITRHTDVRVLAATNVDLEEAMRSRDFREDLYYRLHVVQLRIPDLREHPADIPQLAKHFLHQINPELALAPAALRRLCDYTWPGNIRQLLNTLRAAAALCGGRTIQPHQLGELPLATMPASRCAAPGAPAPESPDGGADSRQRSPQSSLEQLDTAALQAHYRALREDQQHLLAIMQQKGLPLPGQDLKSAEIDRIRHALDQHHWNITATARALGIARNTLHRKINKYRLRKG